MSLELTLEEQELQGLMDKMANEIFSQLGLSNTTMRNEDSAVDTYMQKKLEEENK